MQKLLITGGSGFIGTNAVEHFSKQFEIINIDFNAPVVEAHKVYWKNVDITNLAALQSAVLEFNPDYILHLAARTALDGTTLDDYSANTKGVEHLLKVAAELPNLKKIIITSSMLVCHAGYMPKDQFDYSATTVYGESKIETERITWKANIKCDWAIIRPTSVWGPYFKEPYRNFFQMVKNRMYFHIGHESCTKTYGFVGNSIYQIESLLKTPTPDSDNKVFYIGDAPANNIEEWANEIAHELGFRIPRVPLFLIKCAACTGDILKKLGIKFPMTSFRLKNMTTNNIINLDNTNAIAPNPPYTRLEGTKITLKWMDADNQKS